MTGLPAEPTVTTTTTSNIRRRRNKLSSTHVSGWDHPLVVASPSSLDYHDSSYGSWMHRECHWRTSQRLFTLDPSETEKQQQAKDFAWEDLLCAPIVVFNSYILVASDTILSLYGNFDSQKKDESTQQQRIDTKAIPPLIKFSLSSDDTEESFEFGDKILQIEFHEDTSIVYVLTVESCVYQLKLILEDPATKSQMQEVGTQDSLPLRFQMIHDWTTKLGATCMATCSDGGGIDMVCVGYKSGHIEAWKVPQLHSIDPRRRGRQPRKQGALLEWEGFLYDSIRTLSFLQDQHYLMAIISVGTRTGDKRKEQQTSSMMKILDLKQIADEKLKNTIDPDTISRSGVGENRSLENYSLPQSRGMELIDASTVSLSKDCNLPKRAPVLDSYGANAACHLSVGEESSHLTGIVFPDGIVGVFSKSGYEASSFGIAEANHQLLLSYPAIGNGKINIVERNGKSSSYLATCLRGGTCYLIPISKKQSSNPKSNNSIAVIPFPHDMESDLSDIYVQAFSAGNLIVDGIDLPVLVYAWPGGVIDVYSCGLVNPKAPSSEESKSVDAPDEVFVSRAERRCLRDLIDNGSISLIAKILDELRDNSRNPLLQTDEWDQLFREFKAGKTLPTSEEDITLESLCSIEFQSLRRVLLSLALVND